MCEEEIMGFKKITGIVLLIGVNLLTISCSFLPGGKTTTALYPIRQNNKNGYINRKGEIVIAPQFEFTLPFSEGLAAVCIDSRKCGYIDETGKFIINPQFQSVSRFSEGLAAVVTEGKVGYIDKTGKYVINPQFEAKRGGPGMMDALYTFNEGLARVNVGDKYGFIDKTGKILINPQFDDAMPFFDGLAAARIGEKWGFVDRDGKIVVNPQFDRAQPFVNGLAVVLVGKQYGYIDKTGKILINPQFDFAMPFSDEGLAAVFLNQKMGFIDKDGKYVVNPQFAGAGFYGDYERAFAVTSDLGRVSLSEGLVPVRVGEKDAQMGYADKTGKIVINPQFMEALPFYGGLALVVFKVSGGDEMAWIDKEGKTVWRETRETPASANTNTTANVSNTVNVNTAANTVTTTNTAVTTNTSGNTATQTSETTEYDGTLNNNYQISMSLTRSGESLSGYVTPKSGGASIPVRGTINGSGEFNLSEYDDQNNWTGTYRGKISGGTIDGSWTKPDGSASRPLFLQKK
jgi:hypothetical protein